MNNLVTLCTLLSDVQKTCNAILKKSLVVMKKMVENDADILDAISRVKPDLPMSEISKLAKNASLDMVKDANSVLEELDAFSDAIAKNEDIEDCGADFLIDVWRGDVYDCTEIKSIIALLDDLTDQYKSCGTKKIIELATL